MERLIRDTNPLADHPSVRVCRFALLEVEEMADYGAKALHALVSNDVCATLGSWLKLLDQALAAAGGLDGTEAMKQPLPSRLFSAQSFVYDPVPKRDARFPDPYNMGVNAEVFLYEWFGTGARTRAGQIFQICILREEVVVLLAKPTVCRGLA